MQNSFQKRKALFIAIIIFAAAMMLTIQDVSNNPNAQNQLQTQFFRPLPIQSILPGLPDTDFRSTTPGIIEGLPGGSFQSSTTSGILEQLPDTDLTADDARVLSCLGSDTSTVSCLREYQRNTSDACQTVLEMLP